MKTLYLLRHGKSAWDDPGLADHDRPLAPRGIKAAKLVGRHLADRKVRIDLALCSTALRASDTFDLVKAELGEEVPAEHERALYLCGARALLERVRSAPESASSLMLVAHNPDLHELGVLLAGDGDDRLMGDLAEKFPTGACALLLFEGPRWRDVGPGAGRLMDYVLPRRLG